MPTDEERKEQTRQRVKARYWKRRDELLYERRVRYHSDDAFRCSLKASNKKSNARPEAKARDNQRLQNRRAKMLERERSKRNARRVEGMRGLSLQELERPTYKLRYPGGSQIEAWPLNDEAAKWLKAAEAAAPNPPEPVDTSQKRCPQNGGHQSHEAL